LKFGLIAPDQIVWISNFSFV